MTNLFDFTVQHSGWFQPTYPNAGWQDNQAPLVTGLQARSYWASVLNGTPIDQAVEFFDTNTGVHQGFWFNIHTAGALQGLTVPSPFLVTPTTRIGSYTRAPTQNDQILWRIVVSDQATTPNPSTPP